MEVKLIFGHADNGSATAKMAVDDGQVEGFDYVKLVKLLFDEPEATVTAEMAESYSEAQKQRLDELVQKLTATAKGQSTYASEPVADEQPLEDSPF